MLYAKVGLSTLMELLRMLPHNDSLTICLNSFAERKVAPAFPIIAAINSRLKVLFFRDDAVKSLNTVNQYSKIVYFALSFPDNLQRYSKT